MYFWIFLMGLVLTVLILSRSEFPKLNQNQLAIYLRHVLLQRIDLLTDIKPPGVLRMLGLANSM